MCTGDVQLQPIELSQLQLGPSGDFLISAVILVVVMMAVSAQIQSLSAIFMYDVYQTYINPLRLPEISESASLSFYSDEQKSRFLDYNRQSVIVRHAVVIFFSILTFPAAVAFAAIGLDFAYKFQFIAVVTASTVLPVCLTVLWHRMTRWGFCAGAWGGLVAGFGVWLGVASTYDGGLGNFVANTGELEVFVAATAAAFACGGLFCVLVSLCSGGLDEDLSEEDEWEQCENIDNPVKPWALQYAIAAYRRHSIEYVGVPGHQEVGSPSTFDF